MIKITAYIQILFLLLSLSGCDYSKKTTETIDKSQPNKAESQQKEELAAPSTEMNREQLEERVARLLEGDNVTLRRDVDQIFSLADIYESEGNDTEATRLYQIALQADSWRLEYQLKFARLLDKNGERAQAIEKARLVYDYAENEDVIGQAKELLLEFRVRPEELEDETLSAVNENVEIVIVPIGKVNQKLLFEVRDELQKKMGIKYSIAENGLELGKAERSEVDKALERIVNDIRRELPEELLRELMTYTGLTETDLETGEGRIAFLKGYFAKSEATPEQIKRFWDYVEELKDKGQFDAARLLSDIQKNYPIGQRPEVKGYLGMTEGDIFADDNNFLFGWSRKGYGALSYHRFTADFNEEPPNRPRLRARTVKQAISSSFFILGIPRCTTPTCIRTYPHNLTEHDQKGYELCQWCREQLDNCIKNYQDK
jgi:predicted Zn-dependent protease